MAKARSDKGGSASGTASTSRKHDVQANIDYTRAHHEAGLDYQRDCSDAYFKMVTRQAQAELKAKRPVEEAHAKLTEAYNAACNDPESQQEYRAAYEELVKAQSEYLQNKEYLEEYRAAYTDYVEAEREAAKKAHNRRLDAYLAHVESLKSE